MVAGLRTLLAAELQLGEEEVTEGAQFVDLGLDSISGVSWVRKINEKYGTRIEAIQIYSYPTLGQLSRYVKQEAEKNGTVFSQPEPSVVPVAEKITVPRERVVSLRGRRSITRSNGNVAKTQESAKEPTPLIAVIGIAGQFPKARNLDEFWENISQGRNCISQVPSSRWDIDAYYQPGEPVACKTNSRWIGALEDYDRFDPLFFNLSPGEAENMDPQQRLFLEACWHSIENAGYDAKTLSGSKCGVFVGCAAGDYDQLSSAQKLSAQGFTGNAMSILAARISYFLNLQGPCLSIDTACSSSLVAIAHACDSLLSGSSDVALAGGVCVMAGPALHIMASQAGILSRSGQCFTFDQRADGIVPAEGVGVVMLKRLADAERDRDIIQGVLEGWGVNQDGKTNGITAPNAESQTRLEQEIYARFRIDPANLQLIEAHGTGTKLGDPIEVAGLKQAFQASTQKQEYCALGSVKSNIGHTATAAGVAGLLKLLLAIQHKQLPPTINFERLNEHIDLTDSPFYINQRLQEWKPNPTARRQAAVSSFGFSGTNAHVVVGEYLPPLVTPQADAKTIVPLSARKPEQLREKVRDLLKFLGRSATPINLAELAYTLQVGRTGMEERMGLVVSSVEELAQKLEAYLNGKLQSGDFYQGQVKAHLEEVALFSTDADLQQTLRNWIDDRKLVPLLKLWVKGLDLDWNRFYRESRPRRICLPEYPFARKRYWIGAQSAEPSRLNQAFDGDRPRETNSYLCRWEQQGPLMQAESTNPSNVLVVASPFEGLETAILDNYQQRGGKTTLIRLAETTEQVSENEWTCDVKDPGGFARCFENSAAFDTVFFLTDAEQQTEPPSVADFRRDQDRNSLPFLRLIKSLDRQGGLGFDLYILTRDNHSLTQGSHRVLGAGVAGLGYSLAQSNREYRVRNLDLTSSDLHDAEERNRVSASIVAEPPSRRGEICKIVSGRRHTQAFFPLECATPSTPAIRHKGAYLIVGGSGTVGQIITRNLLRQYDAIVVWVGSSPLNSPKVQAALKGLGNLPLYLQADVTDLEAMQSVVKRIKENGIALRGAIFSAMSVDNDSTIQQIGEDEFSRCLALKALGSWTLHKALEEEPLDFLCYFSSRQAFALLGASEYAAYVAGIASSDAFVRSLRTNSRFRVGLIHWGIWQASLDRASLEGSAGNLDTLSDEEGFKCFELFLSQLSRGTLQECIFAGHSKLLESLMGCSATETVTIAKTSSAGQAFSSEEITIPWQKLAQLRDERAHNGFESTVCRLMFHQLASLMKLEGMLLPIAAADLAPTSTILDKYLPWLNESVAILCENGLLLERDGVLHVSGTPLSSDSPAALRERYRHDPDVRALATLVSDCLVRLPDVLEGRVLATDVIFPNSSMERVEGVYRNNALSDAFNQIVANAVVAYLQQRLQADPQTQIRILEIGAGTGGTSILVLSALRPFVTSVETYTYTDLSQAFLFHAEETFLPDFPFLECRRLDIERAIEDQGFEMGSYDVVIAANVLHATKNIRQTMRNTKALLHADGLLLLNEISTKSIYSHLTFGLLDGWWLFEDSDLRMKNSPLLSPARWQQILEQEGFRSVQFPAWDAHDLGYQIVLCQSDGLVRKEIRRGSPAASMSSPSKTQKQKQGALPVIAASKEDHIHATIRESLASVLKMAPTEIDAGVAFSDYGVDSILGVGLVQQINAVLQIELNTAIIFEYPTLDQLTAHVVTVYAGDIEQRTPLAFESEKAPQPAKLPSRPAVADAGIPEIAVIGMSGMFPKAKNVEEFWKNLVDGTDGVEELPPEYLDQRAFFSAEKRPGKTRCKWGGILADRDCFDPGFFNLSPLEAESMNPHQRLLMQEGWKAIEDAGYNPRSLSGSQTGVFVGAEPSGYVGDSFTGYSDAIIASRLSYVLNLKGPAMVVNTGCSSSGLAIHLACESLRSRETDLALAGGVHASMDHRVQVRLDEIEMLSPSGRCHTFDRAADGTIISESAAVVVLKRLEDAVRGGDLIYGVICGSGTNQDGASNGITAPNGAAQEELIVRVYEKFAIDPDQITYVEAHGTGTKLGDPVEANALVRAFRRFTPRKGFCAVGSAKSHIGHTAAAAGVTGLIKVLLQMRFQTIPRLLHFETPNPLIEFSKSPFYLSRDEENWKANKGVRMAALNSFGHSGTNVHLALRGSPDSPTDLASPELAHGPAMVPLSARTAEQLWQKAVDLLAFVQAEEVDLGRLAYTLQVGRDAMEERVGFLVSSVNELAGRLRSYVDGQASVPGVFCGRVQRKGGRSSSSAAPARMLTQDFAGLLEQWAAGVDLDWGRLYGQAQPRRMRVPVYPFAKERYWVNSIAQDQAPIVTGGFDSIDDVIERIDRGLMSEEEAVLMLKALV